MTKSWREVIPPHPAADLFPMMSKEELIALGEDIKANGLQTAPILWEAQKGAPYQLLDGRNRLDAMEAVGLPVIDTDGRWLVHDIDMVCRRLRGDDPYSIALSMNIRRRHLNPDQKRYLIGVVLKATPGKSNRQIAEQVMADDKTVGKVRRQLEATADIPQLETTTGKDGKARKQPAVKKKRRDFYDYLADKGAKKIIEEAAAESSDRQEDEMASPEQIEDNVLYAIQRINENARVFSKHLRASALDRQAVERINAAIDRMIQKWRSIQSTLEKRCPHE